MTLLLRAEAINCPRALVQVVTVAIQVVPVFADELIGTNHYKVGAQAGLNGMPPANAFTQAQFKFSGYREDVPTPW